MPIFDNPSAAVTDTNDPDQQPTHKEGMDRTTARRTLLRASHEHESVRSGTVSGSVGYHSGTHEQRVEEVEDGTDCSSLLPEFVTRLRKQQPELNSPYRQERLREARDGDGNSEEDKLQAEAAERVAWRARLASREAHGDDGSLDSSLEGGPDDILTKEDQMNLMDAK